MARKLKRRAFLRSAAGAGAVLGACAKGRRTMADVQHVPVRAVTSGPWHHSFGYYDKTPWDATGRYMLAVAIEFMDRPNAPEDVGVVGMVDLRKGNRFLRLAETRAWNWQQGTMLQWLGTAPDRLIIHNDRDGDRYVSRIRDVHTGETRTLPRPVYAVSHDGTQAVTLNFSRVHRTRPGYGYVGVPDEWEDDPAPEQDGIYWMDLETGENRLIISLAQIAAFRHDDSMDEGHHWFNHLLFSPDDSRFIFLHRWQVERGRRTRMFTADPHGSDIYCVADHEMVSHFDWRDPQHILAWARQHGRGDHYYLFTDRSGEIEIVGEGVLDRDGHCSYSPDRRWILTDSYPDREHKRTLILYRPEDNRRIDIGRFYSDPKITGEFRCDLHPRWNRDGTQVCIDSIHEGSRQLYVLDVSDIVSS
ncbi:MAG: hypothetical protein ACE5JM_02045 [Armatimonadota bacterium]